MKDVQNDKYPSTTICIGKDLIQRMVLTSELCLGLLIVFD